LHVNLSLYYYNSADDDFPDKLAAQWHLTKMEAPLIKEAYLTMDIDVYRCVRRTNTLTSTPPSVVPTATTVTAIASPPVSDNNNITPPAIATPPPIIRQATLDNHSSNDNDN
jgi:hypothetical protein